MTCRDGRIEYNLRHAEYLYGSTMCIHILYHYVRNVIVCTCDSFPFAQYLARRSTLLIVGLSRRITLLVIIGQHAWPPSYAKGGSNHHSVLDGFEKVHYTSHVSGVNIKE